MIRIEKKEVNKGKEEEEERKWGRKKVEMLQVNKI